MTLRIAGARVMNEDGTFSGRDIVVAEGVFAPVSGPGPVPAAPGNPTPENGTSGTQVIRASSMWLIPGVYDCHTHITWNDFHQADRERRSPAERRRQTEIALLATLRAGVTTVRDGGGAGRDLREAVASGATIGPSMQISVDLIGPGQAGDLADVVRRSLDRGAQWIKLIATGGAATAGSVLPSHFSRDQFRTAARVADRGGARLMVHTWGGDSVDWAIEAGAGSLEHGMYLTADQARRAAEAGLTYVPTLTIYRYLRELIVSGAVKGVPLQRISDAVDAHGRAVRHARDAGLPMALGSDFGTPEQHGTNLVEIAALIRAGLSGPQALLAATRNGAALLGDEAGGRIAPGRRADAVLLDADPTDPATFDDPSHVVAVVQGGRVVHRQPGFVG